MPSVIVAGGGLAGMAAAAALGSVGFDVDLLEARPYLGGRATSYNAPGSDDIIDNCQHVLLRCCVNLLDLYDRLGVRNRIAFHREFYFIEPGGRTTVLKAGRLPAPLHFVGSFAQLKFLSLREKVALGRAMLALMRQRGRTDLANVSMMDWLIEQRQPLRVVERFWRQVLVSAVNEDLDRMAAVHGFQVMWLGFLSRRNAYEMGVPAVPLGELYAEDAWRRIPSVRVRLRTPVSGLSSGGIATAAGTLRADAYVIALPFEKLGDVTPAVADPGFEHSPIVGVHLWFDRPITTLPHATLLDRGIQWMFNKNAGSHIQVVTSAARDLVPLDKRTVIDSTLRELGEFFPAVRSAALVKAHVVKEVRATFSAAPGTEHARPEPQVADNVFLAGDYTRSGWPATMEGAVRSGYRAAEHVAALFGKAERFVLPDIA